MNIDIFKIPIFIINLEKDKLRKYNITKQLYYNNLFNIYYINAINGTALSKKQIEDNTTTFYSKFGIKKVIGCALSHIKIWKLLKNNNIKLAIILEDDAQLCSNFFNKLKYIITQLPPNFDIAYLGGLFKYIDINNKKNINNIFYAPYFHVGAQGYIMSNIGAYNSINSIGKLYTHIDLQLNFTNLNIIATKEQLISQDLKDSNLADTFPKSFNYISHFKEPFTDSYLNYYLSIPLWEFFDFSINFYFIIYLLIGILFKKNKLNILYFIIPFDILEITNHSHINKIIMSNLLMLLGWFVI